MYQIYANDNLIYSPDLVSDNLFITSPSYSKEVNKSGSCNFYIYPENPFYDKIEVLKTVIVVKENGNEVWRGRILKAEKDFDKRKAIECEGALSFLVDSIIRPHEHDKTMPEQFRYIINEHNNQVEAFKQFEVGDITVEDIYGSKTWEEKTYKTALDMINAFLDDYGGYLVVSYNPSTSKNVISYLANPSRSSNQTIEFGENLLKLSDTTNPANVFTVLIPIGYDSEGNKIDITPINDGKDYIESAEGIATYGRVVKDNTFDKDYTSAQDLITDAQAFLEKNVKASRTIEINALDLHMLDPNIDRIDIYDLVKVESKPHNINEYQMCSKISINMESPESSEYTIGTVPSGIESLLAGKTTTVVNGSSSLPNGDNTQY